LFGDWRCVTVILFHLLVVFWKFIVRKLFVRKLFVRKLFVRKLFV